MHGGKVRLFNLLPSGMIMVKGFLAKLCQRRVSMSWDTCFHVVKLSQDMFLCPYVCLSLSSCLSDYLSVCVLFIYLIYLSLCLSMFLFTHLFIHSFI